MGFQIEPAAFASGVNSFSTILQVLVFISVSALADYGAFLGFEPGFCA
jgi:hypothetical protein